MSMEGRELVLVKVGVFVVYFVCVLLHVCGCACFVRKGKYVCGVLRGGGVCV